MDVAIKDLLQSLIKWPDLKKHYQGPSAGSVLVYSYVTVDDLMRFFSVIS